MRGLSALSRIWRHSHARLWHFCDMADALDECLLSEEERKWRRLAAMSQFDRCCWKSPKMPCCDFFERKRS